MFISSLTFVSVWKVPYYGGNSDAATFPSTIIHGLGEVQDSGTPVDGKPDCVLNFVCM